MHWIGIGPQSYLFQDDFKHNNNLPFDNYYARANYVINACTQAIVSTDSRKFNR